MSMNNTRNGKDTKIIPEMDKTVLLYRSQQTTSQNTSTTALSKYHQRAPMVYSHAPNVPRNYLYESEPLSPYSEMQIPLTSMHPTQQLNRMNSAILSSKEVTLRNQSSLFPRMAPHKTGNVQSTMMESMSPRAGYHNVRGPYARPPMTPRTQQSLPFPLPTQPPITPRTDQYLLPCPLPTRLSMTQQSMFPSPLPAWPPMTPQTQQSLLPSPLSQHYNTPRYNPDQTFTMRSKSSTSAGLTKMNSANTINIQKTKVAQKIRKRFLIGSIDQIILWNTLAKKADLYVIYEVRGILESVSYNSSAKQYTMVIRDEDKASSILHAAFFPIDRDIPDVRPGTLTSFVGRMIGARKLQVLNMYPTDTNDLAGLNRVSFLCQHNLYEALKLSEPEP